MSFYSVRSAKRLTSGDCSISINEKSINSLRNSHWEQSQLMLCFQKVEYSKFLLTSHSEISSKLYVLTNVSLGNTGETIKKKKKALTTNQGILSIFFLLTCSAFWHGISPLWTAISTSIIWVRPRVLILRPLMSSRGFVGTLKWWTKSYVCVWVHIFPEESTQFLWVFQRLKDDKKTKQTNKGNALNDLLCQLENSVVLWACVP